jgi:hypothetical protein
VKKALGARLEKFEEYRKRFDPADRMLTPYFGALLGASTTVSAGNAR